MCDYSLAGIPNRLAVEGEQLVIHRFPASLGLASLCPPLAESWSEKVPVAVCIPPGARLFLRDIPEDLQSRFHVGSSAKSNVCAVECQRLSVSRRRAFRRRP